MNFPRLIYQLIVEECQNYLDAPAFLAPAKQLSTYRIISEHPAVLQAVAFAIPPPTLGEDVAAATVLRPEKSGGHMQIAPVCV